MNVLNIHPELQTFFRPLSDEELADLEALIVREGMTEPLYIWAGQQMLLDGHHRYALCQKHGLSYATVEIDIEDLDAAKLWMIKHQRGRRQWTASEIDYYMGKRYELEKKQGQRSDLTCAHFEHKSARAAVAIAQEYQTSPATVRRNATFATAVDSIATVVPDARQDILSRDTKVGRQEVKKLATIAEASPQTAQHILEAVKQAKTPKAAKAIVQEAAKQVPIVAKTAPQPKPQPKPALTFAVQEPEPKRGLETVLTSDSREMFILHKPDSRPVFNKTNEMVDWASWTWNPVTGCWHGCDYCYAREIANDQRMAEAYPKQFEPTFHPARLAAPKNTAFPKELTRPADKNVFTCSMADLFGKWVPDDWIMQVFERVTAHQEWNFLFLTKFPQRLRDVCDKLGGFPMNAWVGCTVDAQARVATAERTFCDIRASVRWLSVEPMRERLTFTSLEMFDWVVIGGQTQSYFNNTPAFQPEWEWVEHLWQQTRAAQVKVYWKENLTIRPKEVPWS